MWVVRGNVWVVREGVGSEREGVGSEREGVDIERKVWILRGKAWILRGKVWVVREGVDIDMLPPHQVVMYPEKHSVSLLATVTPDGAGYFDISSLPVDPKVGGATCTHMCALLASTLPAQVSCCLGDSVVIPLLEVQHFRDHRCA